MCPRCEHETHEQYGDCGVIVGTLWSGSGAEPDYCGCRHPKIIEHFCAECFMEIWTGDPFYVLGTGPDGEVAARCERCQKRAEPVGANPQDTQEEEK
jgi:hypothetical protein